MVAAISPFSIYARVVGTRSLVMTVVSFACSGLNGTTAAVYTACGKIKSVDFGVGRKKLFCQFEAHPVVVVIIDGVHDADIRVWRNDMRESGNAFGMA